MPDASKAAYVAYKRVFTGPEGMKVLEDLKKAHCLFDTTVRTDLQGRIDPLACAVAEGERNVILRILTILQTKDEYYVGAE